MAPSKFTPPQAAALRERIAREAARLLARGKAKSFHEARTRATRWLSQQRLSGAAIPSQEEIAAELQALTLSDDWDQLSRIQWIAAETARWLDSCKPWVLFDWEAARSRHGIVLHWLISRRYVNEFEHLLLASEFPRQSNPSPGEILRYEFFRELPQVLLAAPDTLMDLTEADSMNRPLARLTLDGQTLEFTAAETVFASPDEDAAPLALQDSTERNWSSSLRPLLETLEQVELDRSEHPEGNALYHSLQVFTLGREMHPWDEEFQWACLLHDVGYVIDARDPQSAAVRVLQGKVSPRVLFLISELPAAHAILQGETPRKSLRKAESYDELLDLARCDREGRLPGRETPSLDEALHSLDTLSATWDES